MWILSVILHKIMGTRHTPGRGDGGGESMPKLSIVDVVNNEDKVKILAVAREKGWVI